MGSSPGGLRDGYDWATITRSLTHSSLEERFPGGSAVKNLPAMQKLQETQIQSLGLEGPLEEGVGNPLQYSCLENLMDRGAWRVTLHGEPQRVGHG